MTKPTAIQRPAVNSPIAGARREQIVAAAVSIITSQGLHNLSLSKIETLARMKRGQLTYYFPTKEDILLAVFDRLLLLMYQQMWAGSDEQRGEEKVWDCVQHLLQTILSPSRIGREFHALQYTFLAQIAHRDDFREKLATLYEEWRRGLSQHWQTTANPSSPLTKHVSGRTISSFLQALLHGLTMQLAADPNAFDRTEMLRLCVGVLAPLFTPNIQPLESQGEQKA
jgi:AcrR family transcriptional regulator